MAELPEGSSMTACDAVGRRVEQGYDLLPVPAPGQSVEIVTEYVNGATSFGITTGSDGEISYDTSVDTDTGAATVDGAGCDDSHYNLADRVRKQPLYWGLGDGARPTAMSTDNALDALRDAAHTINTTDNPCGMGNRSNVVMDYSGPTLSEANFSTISGSTGCQAPDNTDGFSVVDFGNLGEINGNPQPIAATCNWGGQGTIWQSDVRFNVVDHAWTNSPGSASCGFGIDLQSVATHEFGHAMGLSHAGGDASRLTMKSGTPPCTSWRRDLGRGDVLGLYWIDPVLG